MILPVPPIPPVGKILSRPYEGEIGNFQEKKASIDRISTLIHDVNPDYLLFHPIINSIQNVWLLASYCGAWLFGQFLFLFLYVVLKYFFIEEFELIVLFPIIMLIIFLTMLGFSPYLTLKQLKRKQSRYVVVN